MKTINSKQTFEWGVIWMLCSATFLSISFLFLKVNLQFFDYFFLLFLRFFIPFLLIALALTITFKWKEITTKNIHLQIARALCIIVSQYSIAYYITKNTLLNATVLLNSAPLFIPIIEWVFLKHKPGKSTIFGAILSFLGVILVLKPDSSLFSAMSGIGLLAALGQSGSQVLYGIKSKNENPLVSLFYLFFLTSTISFIVFLFFEKRLFLQEIDQNNSLESILIISLVLMAASTLFNQYFRGLAYRCSSPSRLATFLYFSVFVSALLDWMIYKNFPTPLTIIGSCLIILGGVVKIFLRAHILKKKK